MFSFVPLRLGRPIIFSQTILEAYSPDSLGWRFMESDWLQILLWNIVMTKYCNLIFATSLYISKFDRWYIRYIYILYLVICIYLYVCILHIYIYIYIHIFLSISITKVSLTSFSTSARNSTPMRVFKFLGSAPWAPRPKKICLYPATLI